MDSDLCYAAGCVVGQIVYWANRCSQGEEWVMVKPGRTIAAVTANLVTIAMFIAFGGLESLAPKIAAALGFLQGAGYDGLLNKGTRKVWEKKDETQDRS